MTACNVGRRDRRPDSHQHGGTGEPADRHGQDRVERHRRVHESRHRQSGDQGPSRPAPPAAEPRRGSGEHPADRGDAGSRREALVRQRTEIDTDVDQDLPGVGLDQTRRARLTSAAATSPAAATVASIRHCRPRSIHQRRPPRTTTPRIRVPTHHGVDDPGRQGVESAEEVRHERHQGVAEQPLDDQDEEHRGGRDDHAQDVSGGTLDRLARGLAARCAWSRRRMMAHVDPQRSSVRPRRRSI